MILHLHVKSVYFNQIKSGEKTEEYIEYYKWYPRLVNRKYNMVWIYDAYKKKSPDTIMKFLWNGAPVKTIIHPHFDMRIKKVFAIDLTERLHGGSLF